MDAFAPTIGITFAGRRDRMSILVTYMAEALRRGLLTAWHVWDYARSDADSAWIRTTVAAIPGVVINIPSHKDTFEACYMSYTPATYGPDTVFVKFDDDIVFIDLDAFEGFIAFRRSRPEIYLLSANVVNNIVCASIQNHLGFFADVPIDDLHTSGQQATAMHRAFLAGETPKTDRVVVYDPNVVLNINFVAWLGADLPSVCLCESLRTGRDEQALASMFPKLFRRSVAVYGPCVVSHLSFFTQDPTMDIPELLDAYRALCSHAA
jgi:hypothetical protein